MRDIQIALNDVAASSHRGAAFLIALGTTWIVCGLLAYRSPAAGLALAVMFQGAVALPMAFGLQKLLRFPAGHPENPLTSLSVDLAMKQTVAIPAAVLTYVQSPTFVRLCSRPSWGPISCPMRGCNKTVSTSASVSACRSVRGRSWRSSDKKATGSVGASLLVGAVVLLLAHRSSGREG